MIHISLVTLAVIGGFDEIYFHQIRGKILWRNDCSRENILHLIRSYSFSFIFLIISSFVFEGWFILLLIVPFLIDMVVGVLDIYEEGISRKFQNGLHSGEYFTHMLLSFHLGVLYLNLIPFIIKKFDNPNSISISGPDTSLQWLLLLFSFLVFMYSLLQTFILIRCWMVERKTHVVCD